MLIKTLSCNNQTKYLISFCLFMILTFGLFLRYKAANHEYISPWDEAYHALVAQNFIHHPLVPTLHDVALREYDYKIWTSNHIWLHKPPLTMWLMSAAIAIGGRNEIVFRFPSILLGTISILLTFMIGKELFGEIAGIFAATLHSINPLFIRLVSGTIPSDHVDLTLTFFVQISFLLLVIAARRQSKYFAILAGLMLGSAILTKSLPALVVFAALPLFWRERNNLRDNAIILILILLSSALIVLPWKIYTALTWPLESAWESQYTIRHLFESIEGHDQSAYYYIKLIPIYYGGLLQYTWVKSITFIVVLISIIYSIYHCIRRRDMNLLSVLLWALLPYAIFSLTKTKVISYVAIAVPSVLILIGFAISSLLPYWKKSFSGNERIISKVVSITFAGIILTHIVTLAIDRLNADYSICPCNNLYDYPTFRDKMLEIGRIQGKKVILNVGDNKEIQSMYYTGSPAYPDIPSLEEINAMVEKGYHPYIVIDEGSSDIERLLKDAVNKNIVSIVTIPGPKTFTSKHPYEN